MKKIYITGATGFLGTYIVNEVSGDLNNVVYYLSRSSGMSFKKSNIFAINGTLLDDDLLLPDNLDYVIHVAGLAHTYPKSSEEIEKFFEVNYNGTVSLTKQLELNCKTIKKVIFISTVAVYGRDTGIGIQESDSVIPNTPYGQSKLAAENHLISWCKERNIPCLIFRLPLILGDNPPGNLGKMMLGIKSNRYIRIKGNFAKKSIVLATDVARFISTQIPLQHSGVYNLTDGRDATFEEIENAILNSHSGKGVLLTLPMWFVKILCEFGELAGRLGLSVSINRNFFAKLTYHLTFCSSKASKELGWHPSPALTFFSY